MLYENIKTIGKAKRYSINQIEKELHLGKSVLSKWDKHRPSIDKVAKVASLLDVPIEDLIKEGDADG